MTEALSAQKLAATADGKDAPAERGAVPYTHAKTHGEKHFDWITYRNWGYYANVAISLVAVYWIERMKTGQASLGWFGKKFEKLGLNAERAIYYARKSFFLVGGFVVIPPMKWLEDKKPELVKKYNREIYYKGTADTDPMILQSEREVEQAPKQTWKSVITGRLLALVPFYATIGLLWENDSWLARRTNGGVIGNGFFFDRPITWVSRQIGKVVAYVTRQKETLTLIDDLQKISPGIMRSVKKGVHDPMLSAGPYYFISEAITSMMVAVGLYAITRVTGPFFGKGKQQSSGIPETAVIELGKKRDDTAPEAAEIMKKAEQPLLKVTAVMAEKMQAHDATLTTHQGVQA